MKAWNSLVLALVALPALGDELHLPDALSVGWINAPDVQARMAYCVPAIKPENVADMLTKAGIL